MRVVSTVSVESHSGTAWRKEMDSLTQRALQALKALNDPTGNEQPVTSGQAFKSQPVGDSSGQLDNLAAQGPASHCGDRECRGCYEVAPGKLIHPRKSGQEWEDWLARWQPKSEVPEQ